LEVPKPDDPETAAHTLDEVLRGLTHRAIAGGVRRVPGLRRLPVFKLLAIGEVALLARTHIARLEPGERRRMVELLRRGRGRANNLSEADRDELQRLIAKTEPRLFAGAAVNKLSPVPLPRRLLYGSRRG
jgi:hypothetical protein